MPPAFSLSHDMQWMLACLEARLRAYFEQEEYIPPMPPRELAIGHILEQEINYAPDAVECLLVLLALAPHYQPDLLDNLFQVKLAEQGDFPLLGGVRGKQFRGFLPTGETVMFLLTGTEQNARPSVYRMLQGDHPFIQKEVLWLANSPEGEPTLSGALVIHPDMAERILYGAASLPRFGSQFPAQQLNTKMDWDDLVLDNTTYNGVKEILYWLEYGQQMAADKVLGKRIKPGYRALFHGPPGTGKTLTATLLGKRINQPVFRVDLSMVVSKYIGETEKNLSLLFSKAENKNWILFFDEADALFGKRTNVKDAHDRYANQEVSYLLQRIEDFNGLVILASNLKGNIDKAFARRFQTITYFPMPNANQRLKLWGQSVSPELPLDTLVDLADIARKYELSGAAIVNVVQYAHLASLAKKRPSIPTEYLLHGIQREFRKVGKVI